MAKRQPTAAPVLHQPATKEVEDIPFLDSDGSNVLQFKSPDERKAYNAEMQAAAKKALEAQKSMPLQEAAPPPVLPEATPEEIEARRPKLFRVLKTIDLPRGASTFKLPAGKILSTLHYDIGDLRIQGVELVEYNG